MVRAGRPRSRGGILHTLNRIHGLHHARESGKAPGSALKYHSPLEGECHPGARASRPHPYSLVEVAERCYDLAGRQQALRGEPQRQVPGNPTAPLPLGPSGGHRQGRAEQWCGRDARGPGGGILHTLNRIHGLHHARESGKAPCAGLKNHSPLEGECHPGTRASRPHPYFLVEVAERCCDLAGRQQALRGEPQRQVTRKPTAPLPVVPSGGHRRGCAGLWCGRDARVPGGASSIL